MITRNLHSRPVFAKMDFTKMLDPRLSNVERKDTTIELFTNNVDGKTEKLADCDLAQKSNPAPKELLYAALSSCTVFTMKVYYENSRVASSLFKGLNVTSIDCEVTENASPKNEHVPESLTMKITVTTKGTALNESQLASFQNVIKKCPVKQLLDPKFSVQASICNVVAE